MANISFEGKQALLATTYEYCLIVMPVGLYVGLETVHYGRISFFILSPEWAIATIFLLFQAVALFMQDIKKTGRKLSNAFVGLIALLALIMIFTSAINVYQSLESSSTVQILIRWFLFLVASTAFFTLVGAARLAHIKIGRKHGT